MQPRRLISLDRGLADKILACLCTRFNAVPSSIRHALPTSVESWGKIRLPEDGDVVRAASLVQELDDSRDSTYVRVSRSIFIRHCLPCT